MRVEEAFRRKHAARVEEAFRRKHAARVVDLYERVTQTQLQPGNSCSAPSPCKSRRLVPVLRHAVPSDLRLPAAGVARISQERAPATLISSPARNLSVRAGRAHARKRSTHAKPVRDHQARDARRAEAHRRNCLGRLQQRREAQLHSERLSPSRLTRAEGLSRRRAHE